MKRLLIVVAGMAALTLAACETATPYQPLNAPGAKASGGYSDRQIEPDRFVVRFAGNDLTSRETVERFLLLRAAELTVQHGYDWFTTTQRHTDKQTDVYSTPDLIGGGYGPYGAWGGGYFGPRWGFYGPRYGAWRYGYWGGAGWGPGFGPDFDLHQVSQFDASAEIVLGHGRKPQGDPRAFDARAVVEHLGPAAGRPNV